MLLAATAFALMTSSDTIFKLMADNHPAYQILLVNGGFATLPILGWALLTGGLERLHTARPFLHLLRGSLGFFSGYCAIYAYSRLSLANFYAIVFSGPLIVTALSFFLLGEKIDKTRWLVILAGFFGVVLVTHPFAGVGPAHSAMAAAGRVAAILSVSCYALSVVMIRRMRLGESNLAFSLYGYVATAFIAGAMLLIGGGHEMTARDFAHLMLSGFLTGIASICLMTAYQGSPVAIVAPFQYTQILWGAFAGWLLWQQLPSLRLITGATIVAASGLFLIYREMRFSELPRPRLTRRKRKSY